MKTFFLFLFALGALAGELSPLQKARSEAQRLLDSSDYAGALAQATFLNRRWPDDIHSYQLVAAAQMGLGNYSAAEKAIQWMLDLRVGKADAKGWLLVARFREATGDLDGASDAISMAGAQLTPSNRQFAPAVLAYSAHLQIQTGLLESAERSLNQSLALSPDDEAALHTRAQLRIAQDRCEEAAAALRALALSTHKPKYLFEAAAISGKAEDYAAFEKAALVVKAQSDNANRELALFYAGTGKRPGDAERIAKEECERRHDVFTMDAYSVALFASGKTAEAQSEMKRVLAVGTRDPAILKHAAQIGVETKE